MLAVLRVSSFGMYVYVCVCVCMCVDMYGIHFIDILEKLSGGGCREMLNGGEPRLHLSINDDGFLSP